MVNYISRSEGCHRNGSALEECKGIRVSEKTWRIVKRHFKLDFHNSLVFYPAIRFKGGLNLNGFGSFPPCNSIEKRNRIGFKMRCFPAISLKLCKEFQKQYQGYWQEIGRTWSIDLNVQGNSMNTACKFLYVFSLFGNPLKWPK